MLPGDLTPITETGTHVTDHYAVTMTEVSFDVTTETFATEPAMTPKEVTTEVVQEMSTLTEAFTTSTTITVAPEPLTTIPPVPPVVETEGPAETEQPIVTGVAESETGEEVVVEGDAAGEEYVGWKLGWCKFCQFEVRCCF